MRLPRSVLNVLPLVVATATALGLAAPASAATGRYVALGDSYSSGTGAGSYGNSGSCKRSANSYPQLWANANAPSSFAFVACSGARTGDVLNNQVGALTSGTALVTISVGGNDAGFADVMITCNTSSDEECVRRNKEAQDYARTTLPGLLNNVYTQIRNRAPYSRVVVLGYPHIYHLNGSCWGGLSETKRASINESSNVLASVISGRAGAYGFRYIDARSTFDGHEICSWGTQWIKSVSWPADESYHPNAEGQRGGYYNPLEAIA